MMENAATVHESDDDASNLRSGRRPPGTIRRTFRLRFVVVSTHTHRVIATVQAAHLFTYPGCPIANKQN
jgi:hypothetical protein